MSLQLKTARLTVLLDPVRKQEFEGVCRDHDMTPSQVLRQLIRDFVGVHAPKAAARKPLAAQRTPRPAARRASQRQG